MWTWQTPVWHQCGLQIRCHYHQHSRLSCHRSFWWSQQGRRGFLTLVISSRGCAGAHCRRLWQNLQTSHRTFAVSWLSFGTLINNISQRENMIDTSPSSPKTYLSLGSLRSAASDRRFMVTFAKILLGVDNSVIPRQLLYSGRVPFFGILMMIPWFKRRSLPGLSI